MSSKVEILALPPALDQAQAVAAHVHAVRRDFPILKERVNGRQLVWLYNPATTHEPQSVIDAPDTWTSRTSARVRVFFRDGGCGFRLGAGDWAGLMGRWRLLLWKRTVGLV